MATTFDYAVLTKPREDWWVFTELNNGHDVLAEGSDVKRVLKAAGDAGWEAACYCPIEGGHVLFKREVHGGGE